MRCAFVCVPWLLRLGWCVVCWFWLLLVLSGGFVRLRGFACLWVSRIWLFLNGCVWLDCVSMLLLTWYFGILVLTGAIVYLFVAAVLFMRLIVVGCFFVLLCLRIFGFLCLAIWFTLCIHGFGCFNACDCVCLVCGCAVLY